MRRLLLLAAALVVGAFAGTRTASSQQPDAVADALAYLRANAGGLGLRPDLADLQLVDSRESPGARHVRFRQTVGGVPLFDGWVTVNLAKDSPAVSNVLNHYRPGVAADAGPERITSDDAVKAAAVAVGMAGEPRAAVTSERVYYPVGATYRGAWQVMLPALTPLGDWLVVVQAESGKVLLKRNLLQFDSGRVFDPNPVQTSGGTVPPPTDCDTAGNATTLAPQYRTRTLSGISGGQNKLKGAYVDLTAPGIIGGYKPPGQANEASRNYVYACNDDRFEEVMVYQNVDYTQRKIQSLGFTGTAAIMARPIPAHAHYFSDCNAFFDPADGGLHFGDSNDAACPLHTDAAEDAAVIIHEYGHALQADQVPGWGFTSDPAIYNQNGSVGEGFGDFLAGAVLGNPCAGQWFNMGMTACGGQWGLRWLQNTRTYPAGYNACPIVDPLYGVIDVHCGGEIWGGALWDLAEALGDNQEARDTVLTLVLDSHFYLDPESGFLEAAAVRQADVDLYGGAHTATIDSVFAARGIGGGSVSDFPSLYLDVHHDQPGDLVLTIKVGDPSSPVCSEIIWNREPSLYDDLLGYFNVPAEIPACAGYFPPSATYPWHLEARDYVLGSTGSILAFSALISGTERCNAAGLPLAIPDGGLQARATIDCSVHYDPPGPMLDSDGDGYGDARELALGRDPNTYCDVMRADVNGDGVVNLLDLALAALQFGQGMPPAYPRYDQNGDGVINLLDLAKQAAAYAVNVSTCP